MSAQSIKILFIQKIKDLLTENAIEYEAYDTIIEPKTKVNYLEDVIDHCKSDQSNFEYAENIFIFDDISSQLKLPEIDFLVKKNRHLKSKVFISTQYVVDLDPGARMQMDYCLAFKGLSIANLRNLYGSLRLGDVSF